MLASSYDQSCTVDTDCTGVTSGDYCGGLCTLCLAAAINTAALGEFNADIAETPVGSGEAAPCPCPRATVACCRNGACTADCVAPSDTLPDCADAGGTCVLNPACDAAIGTGPANSCAYADEICCLLPGPLPQLSASH